MRGSLIRITNAVPSVSQQYATNANIHASAVSQVALSSVALSAGRRIVDNLAAKLISFVR